MLSGEQPSSAGTEGQDQELWGGEAVLQMSRGGEATEPLAARSGSPDLLSPLQVPSGSSNPGLQSTARCILLAATCQLSSSSQDPALTVSHWPCCCHCLLSGLSLVPLLGQVALFTKAVLLSLAAHESAGAFRNYTRRCSTPRGAGLSGQGCSLGFGNF